MTIKSADQQRPTPTGRRGRARQPPRVRRDILFTEVPEGVLFHDATPDSASTAGRRTASPPWSSPSSTAGSPWPTCAPASASPQRAMVADLVRTLYRRGFARAVPPVDPDREPVLGGRRPRRFDAQIAYVDHHVDDAERTVRAASATPGSRSSATTRSPAGRPSAWCATAPRRSASRRPSSTRRRRRTRPRTCARTAAPSSSALAQHGPPAGRADLGRPRGSTTSSWSPRATGADPHAPRPARGGRPAGRTLLPAWQARRPARRVGPADARRDLRGCWMCAALRLGANGDAGCGRRPLERPGRAPRPRDAAPAGPLAAMVGNLLGYEIFRLTTGALPAETDGQVIVQDLDSLDVVVEPLLPHPRCHLCVPPSTSPARTCDWAPAVAEPSASPQPRTSRCRSPAGPRPNGCSTDPARTGRCSSAPGSARSPRFDDDRLTQTPLRVSTVDLALGHGRRRRIAAFDVHNVAGARLAALAAAAGVYADHVVPLAGVLSPGRPPQPPGARIPIVPARDPWARAAASTPTATRSRPGCRAASLADRARSCSSPPAPPRRTAATTTRRVFAPGQAGLGVDDSPERARGAALLSALAHDALSAALRGRLALLRVEPGRARDDDPVLTFLVRTAHNLGVEVELVELGAARRAAGAGAAGPLPRPRWTAPACGPWPPHTSWRAAAVDRPARPPRPGPARDRSCRRARPSTPATRWSPTSTRRPLDDLRRGPAVGLELVRTFPEALDRLRGRRSRAAGGRPRRRRTWPPAGCRSPGCCSAQETPMRAEIPAARAVRQVSASDHLARLGTRWSRSTVAAPTARAVAGEPRRARERATSTPAPRGTAPSPTRPAVPVHLSRPRGHRRPVPPPARVRRAARAAWHGAGSRCGPASYATRWSSAAGPRPAGEPAVATAFVADHVAARRRPRTAATGGTASRSPPSTSSTWTGSTSAATAWCRTPSAPPAPPRRAAASRARLHARVPAPKQAPDEFRVTDLLDYDLPAGRASPTRSAGRWARSWSPTSPRSRPPPRPGGSPPGRARYLRQTLWGGHADSYAHSVRIGLLEGLERYAGIRARAGVHAGDGRPRRPRRRRPGPARLRASTPPSSTATIPRSSRSTPDRPIALGRGLVPARRPAGARCPRCSPTTRRPTSDAASCSRRPAAAPPAACLEEAVLHGLMEAVERDAFLVAWYAGLAAARDRRPPPAPGRPPGRWWTGSRCTATRPDSSTPGSASGSPS